MLYKVTVWNRESTQTVEVEAANHKDAAQKSGLAQPGAILSVDGLMIVNIRYQVDATGRMRELARYG